MRYEVTMQPSASYRIAFCLADIRCNHFVTPSANQSLYQLISVKKMGGGKKETYYLVRILRNSLLLPHY